mgnify:CR=1 FL=1
MLIKKDNNDKIQVNHNGYRLIKQSQINNQFIVLFIK